MKSGRQNIISVSYMREELTQYDRKRTKKGRKGKRHKSNSLYI
jgi:hypothetical protein